jgi:putative ABC transport system permease protein
MLRNYIRITIRNLFRQKGFSAINIAGLATGMAAFVLIMLFVQNELTFDRHHTFADDIYRVALDAEVMGQAVKTASSPIPMAPALVDEIPEVVAASRIDDSARILVSSGDKTFYEDDFVLADSSIFSILSLPLVKGDVGTALSEPNSLVVTEEVAYRYFGDEDPIGKVLKVDNKTEYVVTGVIRPITDRSHFRPDLIGSFVTSPRYNDPEWLNNTLYTYVRLESGTAPAAVEEKLKGMLRKYVVPRIEQVLGGSFDQAVASGLRYEWYLDPVKDIYLHSTADHQIGPTGDVRYVYILSIIAAFVLFIACINFVNLTTARAAGRAREVGLRKVLGSERGQLVRQFLGESLLVVGISMLLALAVVATALPWFNDVADANLHLAPWVFVALFGITILTGLASGFYPALVLSGFRPAVVLQGEFASGSRGSSLRSVLVVLQFVISVALLVGTGVVYSQIQFLQNQDVGFESDQVLVLPIETTAFEDVFESFRNEALRQSGIEEVASSSGIPGPDHIHQTTAFRGEGRSSEEVMLSALAEVSHEYVETLGLRMLEGRNFSREIETDRDNFLISEAAAAALDWTPAEAIGKELARVGGNDDDSDRLGHVIGVFENAHFNSLHEMVQPVILGMWGDRRYLPVRIQPGHTSDALAALETLWTRFEPGYPFRYFFLDQDYARYYEQETRLGEILGYFKILAVIISCLGLFGLSSFVTTQRTKEIGVRKVLGASVTSVVMLLSREFTKLVVISCAFAFPIAYLAMQSWLESFAYATDIGWLVFMSAGIAALLIAWLTVGYQSIRAAVADPVRSLRYE